MEVLKKSNFQSQLPLNNNSGSSGSGIVRWIGLKDLQEARQAYRKKEYESARKSAALGCLKLFIIAAAIYGIYKWRAGNVIHINDYLTQAENDFQNLGHIPFVPLSAKNFIQSMYDEQKSYKTWPKAGRDFIAKHLKEDAPMSSAIIQHMIDKDDSTFEKEAIRSCRDAPKSSKSCETVVTAYANDAHPYGLMNAMKLARSSRCKQRPNSFCKKALENAKRMSLSKKSSSEVITLAKILTDPKSKTDLINAQDFIDQAAQLFHGEIVEMRSAAEDCAHLKEGDVSAGEVCYDRASGFKKVQSWAAWIVGKGAEWKKNYGAEQTIVLQRDIKQALNGYVDFAKKVCQKYIDLDPCQKHVDGSIGLFRAYRGLLEKSVDDCKGVNVTESASWNRCYGHADIRDQFASLRKGHNVTWKEGYVQKKDKELKEAKQHSLSRLGVDLVEACANFPKAPACGGFCSEIKQKLIDLNLTNTSQKLKC
jgi:hypothetical protein